MAWGFVQSTPEVDFTTAGTVRTFSLAAAAAAGNTVILAFVCGSGSQVSSVTDTQGNVWTADAMTAAVNVNICHFSSKLAVGLTTADTITVTQTGSTNSAYVMAAEYSGLDGTVDQALSGARAGANNISEGPTPALTANGDLVVSCLAVASARTITGVPTGFFDRVSGAHAQIADENGNTGDTPSVTWTWTGGTSNAAASIVAYRAATGTTTTNVTDAESAAFTSGQSVTATEQNAESVAFSSSESTSATQPGSESVAFTDSQTIFVTATIVSGESVAWTDSEAEADTATSGDSFAVTEGQTITATGFVSDAESIAFTDAGRTTATQADSEALVFTEAEVVSQTAPSGDSFVFTDTQAITRLALGSHSPVTRYTAREARNGWISQAYGRTWQAEAVPTDSGGEEVKINHLSLQYVPARVNAAKDPTADGVEMAFPLTGVDPGPGDWYAAQWQDGVAGYVAECLVGPNPPTGTTPVFAAGDVRDILVRVTDNPEVPVMNAGTLSVE